VHWQVVGHIAVAWLITLPATACLAAIVYAFWSWLT
jgi:phosphate/sulfate permease